MVTGEASGPTVKPQSDMAGWMRGPSRIPFFVGTWVAIVFLNAYIIAPAPVFNDLMGAFDVGSAAAGALVSVLLLTAILVQVPGAYLIDRLDNRRMVVASIIGLNLASLPAVIFPTYSVVLPSRLVAGLFVPIVFVASANLVGRAFSETRVRALGVYLSAPPAGYALGTFATPFLAAALGLPLIFAVYSLPMLILLPAMMWTSRELTEERGPMLPFREYVAAFRSVELWRLGLAFAATYALYIFYTSWMPTFLVQEGPLSLQTSGALAATVPALGILSRPVGGHLAASRFARDKRIILAISFLALLPLSLVWTSGASFWWALVLLPAIGFFVQLPFSVYYAFSSQILPERLTGSAYTFMNTTSLIGGTMAPFLVGYLLDVSDSFVPTFLLAAGLAAAGLLLTLSSRER